MELALRGAASVVCSVVLGAGFGVAAAVGMGMPVMFDLAVMFGGVAGLLCSPALVFALWSGGWVVGVAAVALPTLAAAYVGGVLTPPNAGPFLSMGIAIPVYLATSIGRGFVARARDRAGRPGLCERCGYDLSGLRPRSGCPECGVKAGSTST
jgi:hypothetical protein